MEEISDKIVDNRYSFKSKVKIYNVVVFGRLTLCEKDATITNIGSQSV